MENTRQTLLCRVNSSRVLYAECDTRQSLCRVFYRLCRVSQEISDSHELHVQSKALRTTWPSARRRLASRPPSAPCRLPAHGPSFPHRCCRRCRGAEELRACSLDSIIRRRALYITYRWRRLRGLGPSGGRGSRADASERPVRHPRSKNAPDAGR